MTTNGSIDTGRLLLRALTPSIYNSVFTENDEQYIRRYFGIHTDAEFELEKQKFKEGLTSYNKSFLIFYLIEKSSGSVIGWCGYHTWYVPHRRAELGYVLNSDDVKGKGFMKEALPFVIHYGFSEMNLNRIEAFIAPSNEPSLRLVRAHGFLQEGMLREHYSKNGTLEDSALYALLRSEYYGKNNASAL